MTVVSFSLDDDLLDEAEEVMDEMGFEGRSRFIRAAIVALMEDHQRHEAMEGQTEAVMVLTHTEDETGTVQEALHAHEDMIETHLHSHLSDDRCLELLIMDGPAGPIKDLWDTCRRQQSVHDVTLLPF